MLTDLLDKAAKGGWKTSEFWLAVLALVLPVLDHALTPATDARVASWAGHFGAFSAIIVAAYALGRSYLKGKVAAAATAPAASATPVAGVSSFAGKGSGLAPALLLAILLGAAALPASAQRAHYRHSPLSAVVRLPDSVLTPGVVATTDAKVVCRPGYAKTQRHTAGSLKAKVYAEYGVHRGQPGPYEIDHVVSLELGGADVLANLFPQPYFEVPGAHEKDRLENYLHAQVCSGALQLVKAQRLIAGDWYAAYVGVFAPRG